MQKLFKMNSAAVLVSMLLSGCAGGFSHTVGDSLNSVPGVGGMVRVAPSSKAAVAGTQEISGTDSDVPEILDELASGNTVPLDTILEDDVDGSDAALARSERGRLAQIQGDAGASLVEFNGAVEKIKKVEERAKVSASDVGSHTAALLINDNMIPYELAGFERVLVYHFQALNYLMQGNIEGAGVEVRRANAEQGRALKEHEHEVAKAEKEAQGRGFKTSDFSDGLKQSLGDTKAVAAQVKNSFQNAYTFYMSAVVHEIMKEPNDAYIDYKKALEIAPQNRVIQRDVARLAKSLSMSSDIGRFSSKFPQVFAAAKPRDHKKVEVLVLFEDGIVPGKSAISFPIPIPINGAPGLTAVAIPIFNASVAPVHPIVLKSGSAEVGRSERICAIDALAVKDYEENATAMITRQVVRAAIKGAASSLASKHGNEWVGLAVGVFNLVTERADTRSWRSLPQNAQVLRAQAAPGATLQLVHSESGATGSVTLPKEVGKFLIVRATRLGGKLFVNSVVV